VSLRGENNMIPELIVILTEPEYSYYNQRDYTLNFIECKILMDHIKELNDKLIK
jgi:hypothetical protein